MKSGYMRIEVFKTLQAGWNAASASASILCRIDPLQRSMLARPIDSTAGVLGEARWVAEAVLSRPIEVEVEVVEDARDSQEHAEPFCQLLAKKTFKADHFVFTPHVAHVFYARQKENQGRRER